MLIWHVLTLATEFTFKVSCGHYSPALQSYIVCLVFKKIMLSFFKWWQQHSKKVKHNVQALVMPLLVLYSLISYWEKQVAFLNQSHCRWEHQQEYESGKWGALQAMNPLPGLLLVAKTILTLGSCYSLTKLLSYFAPYLIFWRLNYFYMCSKIIQLNISENECLYRIQKYFKI